jgi:hypothetical protein
MEEQLCFAQEVQPNLLIKIKRSRTGAHGLGRFCSSTQSTLMVVVHTKPENILTLYYLSHKIQVDLLSGYTGQFVDQAGWKELKLTKDLNLQEPWQQLDISSGLKHCVEVEILCLGAFT